MHYVKVSPRFLRRAVLLPTVHICCRLGAYHDGSDGASARCDDLNFVMAAIAGSNENLLNRYLFACCSQRSFYGIIAK